MAHLTTDPSLQQRWICIYPAYFNSRRTQQEGRKVSKSNAVDNPKVNEIKDILTYHKFNFVVEEAKQYPRDCCKDAFCKGRVRVQLKNSDGTPFNNEYKTRKDILYMLSEMIPKLKGRQTKAATGGSGTSESSTQQQPSGGGTSGGANKKGKKKR